AETDSLFLYQFEGFGFSKAHTATKKGKAFEFRLPQSDAQFYYLGKELSKLKPIILGTESDIKVKGDCADLTKVLVGSKINQDYEELKKQIGELKMEVTKKMQELQKAQSDEGAKRMAIFELSELDDKKMDLLNEYRSKNPLFAEVVAINTYLSFQNNADNYYSEIDYFANEFFQFADFKSPYYQYNPWVFEAFKEYAITLGSVSMEKELHQSYVDDALKQIDPTSHAYQLALAGVVAAMDERRHKNYVLYGKQLIAKYEKENTDLIAPLKKRIEGVGGFSDGALAPDFVQKTPDGAEMRLSDLRGNVVLVDFWASWCGPCRRENPHVKKLYEKYSHRGFEILGVSLDRTEASWKRAIEQDGLEWYHVSDLKGWKNEVAKMYSVSSIPHTILLDKEGRIIARKLRAAQLEEVLEQIFGD
ncbi:MAG: TlpA disulfide reductase family protein, partial [Bacteroidota bacterium]